MRILLVNDGRQDAGGVHSYLEAVASGLRERGHELQLLHRDSLPPASADGLNGIPQITFAGNGLNSAMARIRAWQPSLVFSHNMQRLDVEQQLLDSFPVVKFMHGYFGTCISGLKTQAMPQPIACTRCYGPACLALYYPRRCGQLSPLVGWRQWRWAERQRQLLHRYSMIVVASRHMRDEYVRNGIAPLRVTANPLFPTRPVEATAAPGPETPHVAFMARMTALKGGDLLIRSIPWAARQLGRPIRLTMIGDGPQRSQWQALADRLEVACDFVGWVAGDRRWSLLRSATLVAVPSIWPEPFGLAGLEAASLGVPAIASDAGGIREWLHPEVNGVLVAAPSTPAAFGIELGRVLADPARLDRLRCGARRIASEMTLARHLDRLEPIFQAAASSSPC